MSRAAFFLFFFIQLSLLAQDYSIDTGHQTKKKKHRFYPSVGFSILVDYFQSPVFSDTVVSLSRQYNTRGFALGSFVFDFRFNLWSTDSSKSISLNFPFSGGFGPVLSSPQLNTQNTERIGNLCYLVFPLLLQYNYGYNSVYNNKNIHGLTVGVGTQLIYAPLFYIDGLNENYKQSWILPIAKMGYRYGKRTINRYFDITAGAFNGWCFKASYGFLL